MHRVEYRRFVIEVDKERLDDKTARGTFKLTSPTGEVIMEDEYVRHPDTIRKKGLIKEMKREVDWIKANLPEEKWTKAELCGA